MPQTRAEVTLAVIGPKHLEVILAKEGADYEIILLGTQSNLPHLAEADCTWMEHSKLAHVSTIKSSS